MEYKVHSLRSYPWGYELPVTIILDDGSIHENRISFDKPPDEKQVAIAIQSQIEKMSIPEPEPDQMISKTEVNRLLAEKGYLISGQTLEDLQTKVVK